VRKATRRTGGASSPTYGGALPSATGTVSPTNSDAGTGKDYRWPFTVFYVDWDDTLMATTTSARPTSEEWRRLEETAVRFLLTALRLGFVYIVTNAEQGWVQESAERHMPLLGRFIREYRVPVVSARSTFERKPTGKRHAVTEAEQVRWKFLAMLTILQRVVVRTGAVPVLVSIGDSSVERAALYRVQQHLSELPFVKTIRLLPSPRAPLLEAELRHLTHTLPALVRHRGPLDIQLAP
jgi:hypothetical protein